MLDGLDAFTTYDLQLALSNVNGTGEFSASVSNRTCDAGMWVGIEGYDVRGE